VPVKSAGLVFLKQKIVIIVMMTAMATLTTGEVGIFTMLTTIQKRAVKNLEGGVYLTELKLLA
jgi:hypothetical protein